MDLTHQNASGESGNALSNGGILRSKAAVSTILWEYSILYLTCLSLRVENRPSVLGIFIYVPWGGVGWGGAITFTYLRAPDVTPRHVHLHVRTYVMQM